MIGYIVANANSDKFRVMRNGCIDWTRDVQKALRFARKEDAESFCEEDEDAWRIMPILMVEQWPEELQVIRDAIQEVERLVDIATHVDPGWWRTSRQARAVAKRARDAQNYAYVLCYSLFKRALLREPTEQPKVLL